MYMCDMREKGWMRDLYLRAIAVEFWLLLAASGDSSHAKGLIESSLRFFLGIFNRAKLFYCSLHVGEIFWCNFIHRAGCSIIIERSESITDTHESANPESAREAAYYTPRRARRQPSFILIKAAVHRVVFTRCRATTG